MGGNGYNRRYTPLDIPGLFDTDNVFDKTIVEQVIQWDAVEGEWNYVTPAVLGGTINLGDLGDVDVSSVDDNSVLQYDSGTSKWQDRADLTLDDGDVYCGSLIAGYAGNTITIDNTTIVASSSITISPSGSLILSPSGLVSLTPSAGYDIYLTAGTNDDIRMSSNILVADIFRTDWTGTFKLNGQNMGSSMAMHKTGANEFLMTPYFGAITQEPDGTPYEIVVAGIPSASETYLFEIVSAGSGRVGSATWKWSKNAGVDWSATVTTATGFVTIEAGIQIGWRDNADSDAAFVAGDQWSFTTNASPTTVFNVDTATPLVTISDLAVTNDIDLSGDLHLADDQQVWFGTGNDAYISWVSATEVMYCTSNKNINFNASGGYVTFNASTHFYMDLGGTYYWRDQDDSNANRMTLNSATGDLWTEGSIDSDDYISCGATDKLTLSHDGSNAYVKWDDGFLYLESDEGTNTDTYVFIRGKGTGDGHIRVYDQDNTDFTELQQGNTTGFLSSTGALALNHTAAGEINCFRDTAEGETLEFKIHGFRTSDAERILEIGVGVDAADTASFDGVSNYLFDGKVQTTTLDVSGVTTLDNDLVFTGSTGEGLAYAQIYEEDGTGTLALAAQDTFYQVTQFSANGESNNATTDHTNDHITIVKAGRYYVSIGISFSQTTAVSIEYDFHVKKNNGATDFTAISAHRNSGGASAVGSCGASGIIDVAAGDTIELWVKRLDGAAVTRTITIQALQLTLFQIGGT